jgi:hypothetical protein
MESNCCDPIRIIRKFDKIYVYFDGQLLYISSFYNISIRMGINPNIRYNDFICSEIIEFNDKIIEYKDEFDKAFLYFAKEFNDGIDRN